MNATESGGKAEKALVTTEGLQDMLSSGRPSAVKIGTEAGARVQIGRRIFWNVRKVERYLDAISGE